MNVKETERIADQIERAWGGPAWHGPSLMEVLEEVRAEEAATKPIQGAHTIWELVLHSAAWAEAARIALNSGVASVPDDENFPAVTSTDSGAWHEAQVRLQRAHQDLAAAIRALADDDLRREVRGFEQSYSLYVLLHGVAQHSLYHAGQMVLLKKAMRS